MGAYSNPQEIEGQQDLAGNARALQGMFNTIVASAQNSSDNITKIKLAEADRVLQENKQRAAKNEALLKELNDGEQNINILLEKGKSLAKDGLNYDCYNGAADRWRLLQSKIDKGLGTTRDKREIAQILASVDLFSKGAANTNGVMQSVKVAKDKIGDGAYDEKGSNPEMLRIYMALDARDGKVLQPGFQKINDGEGNLIDDYSQPGYTIKKWTDKDGTEHQEKFMDAESLEKSLNGGGQGGIVFKTTYAPDNDKIKQTLKVTEGGNGIFETNKGVLTGRVADAYLTRNYLRSGAVGSQGTGGINRQLFVEVNKPLIYNTAMPTINGVAGASIVNINEVQSKYFNTVKTAMDKNNPNNAAYEKLQDYEKFESMPSEFAYDTPINPQDAKTMATITKNSGAAFMQSIPNKQAVGNTITISDKDYAWEKEINKNIPKNLIAEWKKEKEKTGGNGVIKEIKLADGKVRKVLIASEKNEKGEEKLFLEIVGYNTNQ